MYNKIYGIKIKHIEEKINNIPYVKPLENGGEAPVNNGCHSKNFYFFCDCVSDFVCVFF